MKISDLMIGDIVTFKECQNDEAPMPIKIVALGFQNDDENTALAQIGRNTEGCDTIGIDDEIVGIPLTSKILEKNGFENINDVRWEFRTQKTCIKLIWRGKIMVEITNEITNKDEQGRCNIAAYTIGWFENIYVHELQHALRLCEIDKEIVL